MIGELVVKALGQTIEHEGEVVLIVKEIPANCMVLFVSLNTWKGIKDLVNIDAKGRDGVEVER